MPKNKILSLVVLAVVLIIGIGGIVVYKSLKDTFLSAPIETAQPLSHHQFEEVKDRLVQLLEAKDPKASLDYLRNAIQNDTALARECHPLLHHLGHSAYEKYKDFDKTISYQDGLCNSGYTHGTIEAHFMASEDIYA